MAENPKSIKAQVLVESLVEEAARFRPSFSEDLHARVCEALRRRGGAAEPVLPRAEPSDRAARRYGAPAVAAAVVVVACGLAVVYFTLGGWLTPGPAGPDGGVAMLPADPPQPYVPPTGDPAPPEADPPQEYLSEHEELTVPELDALVDSGLVNSRWAYLDHDLRLGAQMLAEQLPFELAAVDEW